jgi:hypothetical protein
MAWPRFRGPYALATLLYFANLLGVVRWTKVDRELFDAFPAVSVLIASLQTACFAVTVRRFSEYARETPHLERAPSPVTAAAALESEPPPSMEPLTSSSAAQQSAAAR